MGKLGLNSGYIGSDQRTTTNGVVGYDKYFLERGAGRFNPVLEFAGLLDLYSGAAAAYSLRLLRKGYTGNAIRVRRSSDNNEQNIGFDGNGNLNTATLLTFCGAGNGFVTTWYDQSGNGYNATQTTAANQPQIVSNGSVIINNNKPSLSNSGFTAFLTVSVSFSLPMTYFSVIKSTLGATSCQFAYNSSNTNFSSFDSSGKFRISNGTTLQTSLTYSANITYLGYILANGSSSEISINDDSATTGDAGINAPSGQLQIMSRATVNYLNGFMNEFILYNSDQSSNRTGIQSNINSYYNIY